MALGHLHQMQNVSALLGEKSLNQAWYCGSPLYFSFSEINHEKSVLVIEFSGADINVTPVKTPVHRHLSVLRGDFETLSRLADFHCQNYVKLTVIDAHLEPEILAKLRSLFPHFLEVEFERSKQLASSELKLISPATSAREVISQFYQQLSGEELSEHQLQIIDEVLAKLNPNQIEQAALEQIEKISKR